MDLGNLSSTAQAEVSALFGAEPSPEPKPDESADIEVAETEVDDETKVKSPDEEASEVDDEVDDSESKDSQSKEEDIEYIKANGKKVKIDYSDRENIKRVYAMAAGARQWQAERDDLQKKYDGLNESHTKYSEVINYLEENKDNHETIFEAITGQSIEDKFRDWAEEQNMISGMTDTEKSLYLSNTEHQKKMKEVERREQELKAKLDKYNEEAEKVESARQSSIANPIFFKYNFDGELGNDQLELRMNRTLWSEAKTELSQFEQVTPEIVEETMKRISNQIRAGFKTSADRSVKKAVQNNRKVVKKKAQDMAVAKPKSSKKQELDEKIKRGDIAGILSGGYDLSDY